MQVKKQIVNSIADCKLADCVELAESFLSESKKIAAAWTKLEPKTSKTDITRKAHKLLITMIISALRDAMKLNVTGSDGFINFDQKGEIEAIAGCFGAEQAAEKVADSFKALHWVDCSVNEKLIFEYLLLNLTVSDKIQV